MKPTPEPWEYTGVYVEKDGTVIAQVASAANGYLIAAAPELLGALKHLVEKCHTYGGPKGGKMDLSQARAAIAKAEGLL